MTKTSHRRAYFPGRIPEDVRVQHPHDAEAEKRRLSRTMPRREDVEERTEHDRMRSAYGKRQRKKVEAEVIVPGREGSIASERRGKNVGLRSEERVEQPADIEKVTSARLLSPSEDEEGSDEESSGDEESSSEEEVQEALPMLKPVFIARDARAGMEPRGNVEEENERKMQEFEEKRRLERVGETQEMVKAIVKREEAAEEMDKDYGVQSLEMPDDEDREEDQEMELALWRLREWKRVLRDRQAEWQQKELGVEERSLRTERNGESYTSDDKEEGRQPHKSYHRGVFFMDRDEAGDLKEPLYKRDLNVGTQEEKKRKPKLPMGVRVQRGPVGRSGRSKFTSLRDEDTAYERAAELGNDCQLQRAFAQLHSAKRRR